MSTSNDGIRSLRAASGRSRKASWELSRRAFLGSSACPLAAGVVRGTASIMSASGVPGNYLEGLVFCVYEGVQGGPFPLGCFLLRSAVSSTNATVGRISIHAELSLPLLAKGDRADVRLPLPESPAPTVFAPPPPAQRDGITVRKRSGRSRTFRKKPGSGPFRAPTRKALHTRHNETRYCCSG